MIRAAIAGLQRVDREHALVYFHILYKALREPVQQAMKAVVMDPQTEDDAALRQTLREFFDSLERRGEIKGLRDALLRLLARAGIPLTEEERARVQACADAETLDHWIENVIGAKTAADVLS